MATYLIFKYNKYTKTSAQGNLHHKTNVCEQKLFYL